MIFEVIAIVILAFAVIVGLLLIKRNSDQQISSLTQQITNSLHEQQIAMMQQQLDSHKTLSDTLRESLQSNSQHISKSIENGLEKTTSTFIDISKRLALIDAAQAQITNLSKNVISLQEVLSDKRSRGAFGEVQLKNLLENMLPSESYALQHQLSNGLRVDCMLFLPEPNGNIPIDSKFPLENFQLANNIELPTSDRDRARNQFKLDIKKHIQDIAKKYINPPETTDGAIMFLPAEAVFAEIHANHPDLVAFAQNEHIWLASPTTMMAILTTASAVLKDDLTKKHIHIMKEHLQNLGRDFTRFSERMEKLSKHIAMTNEDVQQVHISAKKITNRFKKIEQVELSENTTPDLVLED